MHFVARRAKLSSLRAHERLQENAPMRLGIQLPQKSVEPSAQRICAGCHAMQRRILELEISLAHRAFHSCDRMAHHAAEAGLARGSVFHFANRPVKHAAVEQRGIVAARTPLRRFYAHGVLHVFNALAVPGVTERRKMMRGALPFFVNVRVTSPAGLGLGKIICRNFAAVRRLCRTWKKRAARPVALAVHRRGRDRWIFDPVTALPGSNSYPVRAKN